MNRRRTEQLGALPDTPLRKPHTHAIQRGGRFMKRGEEIECESTRVPYDAAAEEWIERKVYQKLPLVYRHVMAA